MSEWGYLARIIKEAKKAGKQAGKRKAIYKQNPKLAEANKNIVDDMSGYNQQLRNYIDGELTEGPLSEYTQKSANDLYETLIKQPREYESRFTDFDAAINDLIQSSDYNDFTGASLVDLDLADRIDPTGYYRRLQKPLQELDDKEYDILRAIEYNKRMNDKIKNFDWDNYVGLVDPSFGDY